MILEIQCYNITAYRFASMLPCTDNGLHIKCSGYKGWNIQILKIYLSVAEAQEGFK